MTTCREMSRTTKEPCGKPLPCADHSTPTNAPDVDYDDDLSGDGCYRCGGRGWEVRCIDDMCYGQDECIHGDLPDPCPACNPKGDNLNGMLY